MMQKTPGTGPWMPSRHYDEVRGQETAFHTVYITLMLFDKQLISNALYNLRFSGIDLYAERG
jgi:hypothetical protein